jgi:hypothetical protein
MNDQYSTPDNDREWVPIEDWQDDETYLLAAAAEAEANYAYEEPA